MRTNKRKLLSLALSLVLLLSLLPTTALAEGETHPTAVNIAIGSDSINITPGKCLTKNEAKSDNVKDYSSGDAYVARYDNTGTLYLNGYNGGQITATGGSLSIVLESENTVTVTGSAGTTFHGILGNNVDLTIRGSGSLMVNATGTGTGTGEVRGILGKTVAVAGSANVTVNATNKVATYAIYAQNGFSTADTGALDLTVTGDTGNVKGLYGIYVNSGSISLGGSGEKIITMKGVGGLVYGIHTNTSGKTIAVDGGSLTIKSETSYVSPIAINAQGVVTLNAPVTIQNFKYGVYNNAAALTTEDKADIRITGGTISINSEKNESNGLWSANNRVAIRGGTVNINTKSYAIDARKGGLDVTGNPTVTLTTEGSYASNAGSYGTNKIDLTPGGSVTATSKGTSLVYPIQGAITLGTNTKVVTGEYYKDGDKTCSGIANGDGTYTVKFAYEAPAAASATVSDVTIEGTTGTEIASKEVTVTLENDKFKAIAADTDVTGWFTNLPAGLEAKIKTAVSENATSATIAVSGTPTANSTAALEITIPAANLVSTADLTVTENANAKFAILTLITEATATVTAPVDGQTPSYTATPGDSAKYTATVTKWTTSSGAEFTDTFSNGDQYAVEVKFEAAEGYKFAEGCTYKINGSNANNGPTKAWVYLTASAAPKANISLNPSSGTNYTFESAASLTVTITNSGTVATGVLTIALDGDGKDAFTVSPTSIEKVEKNNSTATFTVTPKAGLAAGNYSATVKVSGSGVTEQSFTVNYTASGTPAASISLDKSGTVDFGSAEVGYSTAPAAQTVTVTNSGTAATGALTIALDGTNADSFTLSKTSISDIAASGTDTFTVQPKTGLSAGNYTATVKVSGSGVTTQSFNVKFTVTAPLTAITDTLVPVSDLTGKTYNESAQEPTFGGDLTRDTDYEVSYAVKSGSNGSLDSNGKPVGAGIYVVTVTGKGSYKDSFTKDFEIGKATPTYTAPTAKTGLTYTGSALELITAGSVTKGGQMQYKLDSGSYSAAIPTATNAGGYTVYYQITENDNYNAVAETQVGRSKINIAQANQDAPTGLGVEAPTVSGGKGKITGTTDKMEYSTGSSFTSPAGTTCTDTATEVDPGTYYVRLKADSNHHAGTAATVTVPDFGVTPTYRVTITAGTGMTLASGNASQTDLTSAMTDVVYTANTGYYFPTDYSSAGTTSGVTVTRNSYTQITVSGTPTANVSITLAGATAKAKETTPTAAFTAESENGGKLSGVDTGMKYSVDGGSTWSNVTGDNMPITNVTTTNGVKVKKPAADTDTRLDSDVQTISVSKGIAPVGVTAVGCTTGSNNNGKLQNVTAEMEYQKSGATTWTGCGGAEVTDLTNGTYYVRVKAIGTVLASDNLSVEIAAYVAPAVYTITFNGNGGTPAVGTMTTTGGKLASLPTATRTGSYSFDGWYTAASGGTKITTACVFSANTTVYAHWTYTGGGGGGGSYTPSYTVSVDKTENGTITVSPKSASKGDTVTVTVKPDKGYELDTLKVLDKNGDKVKLTEKNGKYTFTMPAGKVTVKGSFAEEAPEQIFADVPVDAYYYEAVKWAAEKGITGGVGNDLFAPNQPCTRAQIVTFLWRAAGSPEPKAASSFTDVAAGSYYAKAVAWAVENGITTGVGGGSFAPDQPCDRAQAVTFLFRALSAKAEGKAEFSDVPAGSYYADAVAWAAANGVTTGVGGDKFAPTDGCTRAQIVTFLYRAYNK